MLYIQKFLFILVLVCSGKSFIFVRFNTFCSFIGTSGLRILCLIEFRAAPVSIIMGAGIVRPSVDISIDGISRFWKFYFCCLIARSGCQYSHVYALFSGPMLGRVLEFPWWGGCYCLFVCISQSRTKCLGFFTVIAN